MALEFLGFWVTWDGHQPLKSRVEAILRIAKPTNIKQVCMVVDCINFIKNHIPRHDMILKPMIKLTKKGESFIWGQAQQEAFKKIKALISESIMLAYPDINQWLIL